MSVTFGNLKNEKEMTEQEFFTWLDIFEKNSLSIDPVAFAIVEADFFGGVDWLLTEREIFWLVQIIDVITGPRDTAKLDFSTDLPTATRASNVEDPVGVLGNIFPTNPKTTILSSLIIRRAKVEGSAGIGSILSIGPNPGVLVDSNVDPVGICCEVVNTPIGTPVEVFVYVKRYKF